MVHQRNRVKNDNDDEDMHSNSVRARVWKWASIRNETDRLENLTVYETATLIHSRRRIFSDSKWIGSSSRITMRRWVCVCVPPQCGIASFIWRFTDRNDRLYTPRRIDSFLFLSFSFVFSTVIPWLFFEIIESTHLCIRFSSFRAFRFFIVWFDWFLFLNVVGEKINIYMYT